MSTVKASAKKRASKSEAMKSAEIEKRLIVENDFDADLSENHDCVEQKDGQKKNEETMSSVASEIASMIDELSSKVEKDRQSFAKSLSKSSKECETLLKNESAKFQAAQEKFFKEKAAHLRALQEVMSKYEEEKERLLTRYEQQRKKEKSMISELEKACAKKIAELEESLKKKKQDDKTFSILRKTLGSFLENASDDDFPPEDGNLL